MEAVHHILADFGYHPSIGRNRVYLYRQREIQRYFSEVGTHNPKHLQRYEGMACSYLVPGRFRLRREIVKPKRSPALAEFVGIMLGDGGIGHYQATITLNAVTDTEYADFVVGAIGQLFGLTPSRQTRENVCVIVVSSVELVEFLCRIGLVQGNKVKHQANLPSWIFADPHRVRACLRGLMVAW